MARDHETVDHHGQQLEDVILAYLDAVDAGQPPAAGEVIARYPELAEELRAFFADQARLEPVLSPWRGQARGGPPGRADGGVLRRLRSARRDRARRHGSRI